MPRLRSLRPQRVLIVVYERPGCASDRYLISIISVQVILPRMCPAFRENLKIDSTAQTRVLRRIC